MSAWSEWPHASQSATASGRTARIKLVTSSQDRDDTCAVPQRYTSVVMASQKGGGAPGRAGCFIHTFRVAFGSSQEGTVGGAAAAVGVEKVEEVEEVAEMDDTGGVVSGGAAGGWEDVSPP